MSPYQVKTSIEMCFNCKFKDRCPLAFNNFTFCPNKHKKNSEDKLIGDATFVEKMVVWLPAN
jgi:hypothetical protein